MPVAPIEPNLVRANVCGTCQQRSRRALEAINEPDIPVGAPTPSDFRRNRSIVSTVRESQSRSQTLYPVTTLAVPEASNRQLPQITEVATPVHRSPELDATQGDPSSSPRLPPPCVTTDAAESPLGCLGRAPRKRTTPDSNSPPILLYR
ncbi:hypothetical protein H4S07_005649 [Coemansia furcata]|uniref:Uncharacterized protein n=1 Tax=Coemansia furcata TaxID=417177 RepID=A0ACC1L0A1_9FUNG|nr:hypothetical protein H4S07_005649 [Coemansia furcata]